MEQVGLSIISAKVLRRIRQQGGRMALSHFSKAFNLLAPSYVKVTRRIRFETHPRVVSLAISGYSHANNDSLGASRFNLSVCTRAEG